MPSHPRIGPPTRAALAERVQSILGSKKLTLYQVSQQSAELYGRSSRFFLPHNLYYDLRAGSFTPSIHQISALSRISGYRLVDWLRVFGFDLEDIPRLQVLLPAKRTLVIDTSLTDPNEWIPWFDNRADGISPPSIAPLAKLLRAVPAQRLSSLQGPSARKFYYAKVGTEDAFAFPVLIPGSIVRVNAKSADIPRGEGPAISDRIFLVEHSKGFCCSRVRILNNGAIVPYDIGHLCAQVELRHPQEAKLWGAVDFEFRPLLRTDEPQVAKDLARPWKPQPLSSLEDFAQLLKGSRRKRNLSIREVAHESHTIAQFLHADRYMLSPSSLCEYELGETAPRDFHKIITLCSICGLPLESAMRRMGVNLGHAGAESMPDRYLSQAEPAGTGRSANIGAARAGFLEQLLKECLEIPFFLRHSLEHFSGSTHVSLDDFFWVGGDENALHPYLERAIAVMVNRRRKTPLHHVSKRLWQQPIYMLLKRNGTYVVACCGVENDKLVLHPYTQDFRRNEEYRLHQDAEVVGQVVAIARRIS